MTETGPSTARRRFVQGTAGLALAGLSVFAIVAGSPDVSSDGGRVEEPAGTTTDPGPGTEAVTEDEADTVSEAEADALNRRLLVAALGPDFRVSLSEGRPPFEYVQLVPGSASARAIPLGYAAEAYVSVADDLDPADLCAAVAGTDITCARRTTADGRDVLIRTSTPATPEIPSVAVESVYVTYPDGHVVRAAVFARGDYLERDFTVPKAALAAWLHGFEDALIAAASDPRMTAGSSDYEPAGHRDGPKTKPPQDLNRAYLVEALGPSFSGDEGKVTLKSGSPAARQLPAGYSATASVYFPDQDDVRTSCESTNPGAPNVAICRIRPLDDGREVNLETLVDYLDSDSIIVGQLHAVLLGAAGEAVVVQLNVRGTEIARQESVALRDRVVAWLQSFVDAVIVAATDPRMAPDPDAG